VAFVWNRSEARCSARYGPDLDGTAKQPAGGIPVLATTSLAGESRNIAVMAKFLLSSSNPL
jgi:hypothetical protein